MLSITAKGGSYRWRDLTTAEEGMLSDGETKEFESISIELGKLGVEGGTTPQATPASGE